MKTIDISSIDSMQSAAEVLKNGGVLIFPTDTVYGIGCLLDKNAIKKLYQIKNRPADQPTAVLMSRNIFDAKRTKELILDSDLEDKFYAGKLTIVDDIQHYAIDFPKIIIADEKVGVRLPNFQWLEKLIDKVGPIVATSANKKGDMTPTKFDEISNVLIEECDLTISSDEENLGQASEIFDIKLNRKIR